MAVDEPLDLIAALADRLAPRHCTLDADGSRCTWYHGTLDYLRQLGLMTSPAEDRAFLQPVYRRLLGDAGAREVLLSGAADCALLVEIAGAARAVGGDLVPTLVDRCATPLELNRWFAARRGLALETTCADLLHYAPDRTFDLVTTHCFLGYFTPDERPLLLRRWHELLRPGGHVVTVNAVRPAAGNRRLGFDAARAAVFTARGLAAFDAAPIVIPGGRGELARRLAAFTATFPAWQLASVDELGDLFTQAGFELLHCAPLVSAEDGRAPGEPGPDYHGVIARRR